MAMTDEELGDAIQRECSRLVNRNGTSVEDDNAAIARFCRELLGSQQPAELTRVREDIDRTARVVQALGAAFTSTQVRSNLATRIESEACAQEERLIDLLARERALMAGAETERPAQERGGEAAYWKDYATKLAHAIGICHETDNECYAGPLESVLARVGELKAAHEKQLLRPARDVGRAVDHWPQALIMAAGGWKTEASFKRYGIVDDSEMDAALANVESRLTNDKK